MKKNHGKPNQNQSSPIRSTVPNVDPLHNHNKPEQIREPNQTIVPDQTATIDDLPKTDWSDFSQINIRKNAPKKEKQPKHKPASLSLLLFSWFFFVLYSVLAIALSYVINTFRIFLLWITIPLFFFFLLFLTFCILGKKRRIFARISIVLSIILSLILGGIGYYVYNGLQTISNFQEKKNVRISTMSIAVLKDSPIKNLKELDQKTVSAPIATDRTRILDYLSNIKETEHISIQSLPVDSYLVAAKDLISNKTNAMLLSDSWLPEIEQMYPNFRNQIRILNKTNLVKIVADTTKKHEIGKGMNIYISGIDTSGPIATVSRSDVNILMTLNPSLHELLLTNIPRDTYVSIPDDGQNAYDKLTHAGLYGVETSIHTLEKFLDTKINYYIRVNFDSLVKIVDQFGGIDLDNPVAFKSRGYTFDKGLIHLDGQAALIFSRERYSLAGGDFDRGRNQQRVIIALFKKMMSPKTLLNFKNIMDVVGSAIQTNIPPDELFKIATEVGKSNEPWNTKTIDVSGTGRLDLPSHLIPNMSLYVMQPSEDSVNKTKKEIQSVLNPENKTTDTTSTTN